MGMVWDSDHSDGAPTAGETGIRVKDVVSVCEHNGYSPDHLTLSSD